MPSDRASAEQGQRYLTAWSALGSLLQSGHTWSGHERNCVFLNTRGQRFADVSALSGLDHDSDSRAVAATDWDLDGDLDLWFANRTSPRVRFMRNEGPSGHHFVALRLEGTKCNRDAIGARVELHAEGRQATSPPGPVVRTLRAGDGYLSQSSKWIHFGLGAEAKAVRLVIHWPGGEAEKIGGLTPDAFYRITQGSGAAVAWDPPRRTLRLEPSVPSAPARPGSTRLLPHRRLPLPRLEYVSYSGRSESVVPPRAGFRLVTLWATWCAPCLAELRELADNASRLRDAGLEVVALNVDDSEGDLPARLENARASLEKLDVRLAGGVATRSTVEVLDVVPRVLVTIPRPLALPSSFLIDQSGHLVAVYRGRVSSARLRKDLEDLAASRQDPRAVAVPFPGRWFTNPFPPDLLAIPRKLLEISLAEEALDYLAIHVARAERGRPSAPLPAGVSAAQVVDLYSRVGAELRAQQQLDRAIAAFRLAVAFGPQEADAHARLAMTLQEEGHVAEALAAHRRALELEPAHVHSGNSMAWLLATSSDASVRDPDVAIRTAEVVCRRTGRRMPSALDTLAAAYAAGGRFEEAIGTARSAVDLATSLGDAELAEKIRERLRLYEAGRAYVETPERQ